MVHFTVFLMPDLVIELAMLYSLRKTISRPHPQNSSKSHYTTNQDFFLYFSNFFKFMPIYAKSTPLNPFLRFFLVSDASFLRNHAFSRTAIMGEGHYFEHIKQTKNLILTIQCCSNISEL